MSYSGRAAPHHAQVVTTRENHRRSLRVAPFAGRHVLVAYSEKQVAAPIKPIFRPRYRDSNACRILDDRQAELEQRVRSAGG